MIPWAGHVTSPLAITEPAPSSLPAHGTSPPLPNMIMMSASPLYIWVKVRGVTSLHTLKARLKASSITSRSRSGE